MSNSIVTPERIREYANFHPKDRLKHKNTLNDYKDKELIQYFFENKILVEEKTPGGFYYYSHLPIPEVKIHLPEFSYYSAPASNTTPYKSITLLEVYKALTGPKLQGVTEGLRDKQDKKEARDFKAKHFPYVTFSGTFTSRKNDAMIKHSGYLCMDLDKLDKLDTIKKDLLQDPEFETLLLFTSPSGNGLKWVIRIVLEQGTHLEWFLAICSYLKQTYNLIADSQTKEVSRACFLCSDPSAYINPKLLTYAK